MIIQVLGAGCPKCKILAENADIAARELNLEYEIKKVTDIVEIMDLGIMMTPALIIDGEIKVEGKVSSVEELKEMFNTLNDQDTNISHDLKKLSDDELICFCSKVSKGAIRKAILDGASSIKELQEITNAGVGSRCKELNPNGRCCHPELQALIKIYGNPESDSDGSDCCCCSK